MSLKTRLRQRTKPANTPRLRLEALEDRLALSTIDFVGRELVYTAGAAIANNLTVSRSGTTYTFTETAEVIQVGTVLSNTFDVDESAFDTMRIVLDDQADTVTLGSINRPTIVLGGDGDDTANVLSNTSAVAVLGGNDNDTVNVGDASGMEGVLAQVTFNGGDQRLAGRDVLRLNDQGAPAVVNSELQYTVNPGGREEVSRERDFNTAGTPNTMVSVSYSGLESLVLDASGQRDSIFVDSTATETPVEVNAGGGDDFIRVNDSTDVLDGRLTVDGEQDDDTLLVQEGAAATDRNFVIRTDSLTQGDATIDLDDLENLTIDGTFNSVNNNFTVESANGTMSLSLVANTAGNNRVVFLDNASTDDSTYSFGAGGVMTRTRPALGLGIVTARLQVVRADRLVVDAGSGDNVFDMSPSFTTPLTLVAGAGVDTINYSAFGTAVEVNLATGRATGAPILRGIENANGGSRADILVGNNLNNELRGNGGRDLLIGGRGRDTIFGGDAQDLMIAGPTVYDGSIAPLRVIRNVWASGLSYLTRIDQLKNVGVGAGNAIRLNETTVRVGPTNHDGVRDRLFSENNVFGVPTDRDWFWAHLGGLPSNDVILGRQTAGPFIEMVK
jgi:Ca2+-binding RTX toxin-like protein